MLANSLLIIRSFSATARGSFSATSIRSFSTTFSRSFSTTVSRRFIVPTPLYSHQNNVFAKAAYFGAFGQLVFWLNLAHFAWTDLRAKNGAIAPPLERISAASVSIGIGALIAYFLHFYAKRRITSISLLPGGLKAEIKTANLITKNSFTVRVADMSCNEYVYPTPTTTLNSSDLLQAYKEYQRLNATKKSNLSTTQQHVPYNPKAPLILAIKGYNVNFVLDRFADFHDIDLWNQMLYRQ